MRAPINKIIPFSNVDGPGNRTAIFFQGCPFQCLYCHNPETIHACINCHDCVKTCPTQALTVEDRKVVWHKELCVQCDTCIKTCTHLATPKIERMSIAEVLKELEKTKPFIRGITVSGGECMVHADFLLELFKAVKTMGLSCIIDSNGAYDFESYPELLAISDGVMLDVKAMDPLFHQELCGMGNESVLKNLRYLLEMNKLIEVRTVLLPFHNEQNRLSVDAVSKMIKDATVYKLLRYRPFGVRELGLEKIGRNICDEQQANDLKDLAVSNGAIHTTVV